MSILIGENNKVNKSYYKACFSYGRKNVDSYFVYVEFDGKPSENEVISKVNEKHLFGKPGETLDYVEKIEKKEYYQCTGKDMPVVSWEDLAVKYPMQRHEMDSNTEKTFVEECFKLYEQEGFSLKYWTPLPEYKERIGEKFKVLGRCDSKNNDIHALPMWEIEFSDGEVIYAFPEEVIPREMTSKGCDFFKANKSIDRRIAEANKKIQEASNKASHENEQQEVVNEEEKI